MKSESSVTVIVLNWNGRELLEDCLQSLEKVNYEHFNVLVVDNGSTDDSVEYIHATFPNFDVLELENNIGYAAGNNAGFKHTVLTWNPDVVVFLNNDTFVDSQFLTELVDKLQEPECGISSPKIYYAHEPEKIWYNGANINLNIGKITHRNIREIDTDTTVTLGETDYATGCCLSIKSELFSDMNGFDEGFPMYAEDIDLSIRVINTGKTLLMAPDSKIWHKVSSSMGGELSIRKIQRKFSGLVMIYKKHAAIAEWISIILLSPYLVLTNIIKYFRLRISNN